METYQLKPDPKRFKDLCDLIETLRSPDGCPWDRKQTPETIINYLIEEGYELADAVADEAPDAVCEEIGDVLFLLFFLVKLYSEKADFGLNDVLDAVHAKMVRRHPHVFTDLKVQDSAEVRRNWTKIKRAEKLPDGRNTLLDRIPHASPALKRAHRISEAVAEAGLDSRTAEDIWQRIDTAMTACRRILPQGMPQDAPIAYGDLLWALAALGPAVGVEPHKALSDALDRFEGRFRDLEKEIGAERLKAGTVSSDESAKIAQLFE